MFGKIKNKQTNHFICRYFFSYILEMGCGTSKPTEAAVITPNPHVKKISAAKTVTKHPVAPAANVNLLSAGDQKLLNDKKGKIQAIKNMFEKYDKDKDGGISIEEFKEMNHHLGLYITSKKMLNIDNAAMTQMRIFQINGKKLDFDNFMEWYNSDGDCKQMELNPEEMLILDKIFLHFNTFDKDGSGVIDSKEFNRFYDDLLSKVLNYNI
jgi:Ca2+-binding EF-hand superfamily protein